MCEVRNCATRIPLGNLTDSAAILWSLIGSEEKKEVWFHAE